MEEKINNILKNLTLDEKISLFSGADFWSTVELKGKGVPKMYVADGPCGLRKQEHAADHLGINKSIPATAFVSGGTLASTWNKELMWREGEALGKEAKLNQIDILLGPAVNIVRSPLCGRNFEYFSEDPYLAGKTAAEYILGVESTGTGTSIKHYAANNQETEREYINAVIDERALREIYLAAFEEPIKRGKPRSVMTALNMINGEYGAEQFHLLREILRKEWEYKGFVISDWFGIVDQVKALKHGMNLEMPYSEGVAAKRIREAYNTKRISEDELDEAIFWNIQAALLAEENRKTKITYDPIEHHRLAREIAEEGIVLLKNENNLLPISKSAKLAVIGDYAIHPRYRMSSGSAKVEAFSEDIPFEEIQKISNEPVVFAQGFEGALTNPELIQDAVEKAQFADVAVIFLGIPEGMEGEGKDRKKLALPDNQIELLETLKKVQKNLVVVLHNGGAVTVEWQEGISAIWECFLAGQGMGYAIARLLYGEVVPSGKLPVSIPTELEQTPSYLSFPGNKETVIYDESIFVGYRYYDKKHLQPAYPFGHGLSYTSFSYSDLKLDKGFMTDDEILRVSCKVRNTGNLTGKEVVQLYVGLFDSFVKKPVRELRGFEKIVLKPGEEQIIYFDLSKRAFAYYDVRYQDWYVDEGYYTIQLGASSRDIRCTETIRIAPVRPHSQWLTGWSTVAQLRAAPHGEDVYQEMLEIVHSCPDAASVLKTWGMEGEDIDDAISNLHLRFITLITQGVLDNVMMKAFLDRCNYG